MDALNATVEGVDLGDFPVAFALVGTVAKSLATVVDETFGEIQQVNNGFADFARVFAFAFFVYADRMESYLALQVLMMPKDTNGYAVLQADMQSLSHLSIFGGVILSYIDQAGAIAARREVHRAGGRLPDVVTVAMNRVEFKQPVLVGDVVRFLTRLIRIGKTSVTIDVVVEAERGTDVIRVTEAEVIYVGVDPATRQPRPLL